MHISREDDGVKLASQRCLLKRNGPFGTCHSGSVKFGRRLFPDISLHWAWRFNESNVMKVDRCAHLLSHTLVQFGDLTMDIHLPCIRSPSTKFTNSGIGISHDFECHCSASTEWMSPNHIWINAAFLKIERFRKISDSANNFWTVNRCPCIVCKNITNELIVIFSITEDRCTCCASAATAPSGLVDSW